jgi:hypothetical protein
VGDDAACRSALSAGGAGDHAWARWRFG